QDVINVLKDVDAAVAAVHYAFNPQFTKAAIETKTHLCDLGGNNTIVEEQRLAHQGRELLVVVGLAAVESTCCGTQGCRFVNVPGYVVDWKHRLTETGLPASEVETIEDAEEQAKIREMLNRQFPYSQILFPV
ncbi:MAG: hypothetical protein AAB112_06180, partial [Thermodesulfobacteriota bacterium]